MIHDAVIAGAGPVGLFLACELRLFGLSVLVLEKSPDPRTPLKRLPFGMRGLSIPTMEALYRRGLLGDIASLSPSKDGSARSGAPGPAHRVNPSRRPGGHFAGIQFFHDAVDETAWPYRLSNPADATMAVDLESLESMLARRATQLGADIRRGVTVERFEPSDDEVTVFTNADTFRARWLVGCDGGRSAVRKAGNFAFVGTEPEFTGYSAEVELTDPRLLQPGRHYTASGMYTYTPPGTVAMVEFDGGACHRIAPITLEHVQAVLRRIVGNDELTVSALKLATTWTDRAHQASSYRDGRVLLAGDAAHIHSPLGGQGLNLGLGDAMNLGWKLAAVVRGDAPEGLLDTYQGERQPVGASILDWSRAQVAIMRPSKSSRALEAILRGLIDTRDGATYFAGRVWGLSQRYDLGSSHPLVGRSVPDVEFSDGTRVGKLLQTGNGLLIDFDTRAPLQRLSTRWSRGVTYIADDTKNRLGLKAILVRPDGVVAWATDETPQRNEVASVMARWFVGASSLA
jgi:2-polyprenyl-6-methoxyphenol hydroxylase-like FAD-dependent oxidoreductase